MKNIILLAVALLSFSAVAQDEFSTRAKTIAQKIEQINKEEKAALKEELEAVNKKLENGEISTQDADLQKIRLAEVRAKNIEDRVAEQQAKLDELIQEQVDGKINQDSTRTIGLTFTTKKKSPEAGERRTTSQMVFAFGLNHLETNKSIAHSDFGVWRSKFYEWGVTWKTRLMKDNNLLHAKYGATLMFNNLRPTRNRYFDVDGRQTNLVTAPINLDKARFSTVYLAAPLHLEFDFGKKKERDGKPVFLSHQSFRVGVGGYVGGLLRAKQVLKYDDADGNRVKDKTIGDFNVTEFIYGLSTYIGYRDLTLYAKYDLNPFFKDNAVEQRNISLGLRFDFQ